MAAGVFSALLITAFKLGTEELLHLSSTIYGSVRANPVRLPLLVLGAALLGFAASFLYALSHNCRGGGIPSSVAAIRGILTFRWWSCLIILPLSSFLSALPGGCRFISDLSLPSSQ